MRTTILGIIGGVFLVWYSINQSSQGNISYLDKLGILIVLGGTLSSGVLTFGVSRVVNVFIFSARVFRNKTHPYQKVIQSLYPVNPLISNSLGRDFIVSYLAPVVFF